MDLAHLFTISIELEPIALLGDFPLGERRLIRFTGGTFAGPSTDDADHDDLRGAVASGGVDWQTVRGDGAVEIRAHYLLTTDRGEPIEVASDGIRFAEPPVMARLAAGEAVDPDEYYFRTHIRLFTSSPRLSYLNRLIAVSSGARRASTVDIHVHRVR